MSDLLFRGEQLIISYNFQGAEHKGALQVIDVSDPEAPILSAELILPRVDLNRIQLYQDRDLIVAAGTAERAATLEVFDLGVAEEGPAGGEGQLIFTADDASEETLPTLPQLVASLSSPTDRRGWRSSMCKQGIRHRSSLALISLEIAGARTRWRFKESSSLSPMGLGVSRSSLRH